MKARETQGMLLGLVGVMIFSLTLPMTRIVVAEFNPLLNGLGRALAAAVPAALLLAIRREKWPTWPQVKSLAVVSLGVIVAFPVFSAFAMKTVPASHGAIVNGLQPLAVAIYAAWLSHERPSKAFWFSALLGSALVVAFALQAGGGTEFDLVRAQELVAPVEGGPKRLVPSRRRTRAADQKAEDIVEAGRQLFDRQYTQVRQRQFDG